MDLQLGAFGFLLIVLVAIAAASDWFAGRLPNWLNLAIFAGGVSFSVSSNGAGLFNGLAAGLLGGGAMYLVSSAYRVSRGRDGLGGGDIKFVAACGPWIGVVGLAPMVLFAAMSALAFVLAAVMTGRQMTATTEIRFGPFLAAGAVLVWSARVAEIAPFYFKSSLVGI